MLSFDQIYSPVQALNLSFLGIETPNLFIKRDDLIHPFISGNKWRKLKKYIKLAQQNSCHTLITFGGAFSNHLVATACAGANFGLRTKAYIRGEYANTNNVVLTLCRLFGMELCPVNKEEYKQLQQIEQPIKEHSLWIKEGGFGMDGAIGCEEVVAELPQVFDHLFCAMGTGTTVAGLLNGIAKHKMPTQVNGISVLKGGEYLKDEISSFADLKQLVLHTNFHQGGYAKTTEEQLRFMADFAANTGVLLDPIYTSKMMMAVVELYKSGYLKIHDKVICLHTGGLTGLLSEKMLRKFSLQ